MKLQNITKITKKSKKRLGLGHGSGRVKTSGRGTKGQKARTGIPLRFEGGALALIKRMPFHRGKGKNKMFGKKPIILNVKVLNILDKGSIVNIKTLASRKIIDEKEAKLYGIKILGDGDLKIALTVELPVSAGALKKIEKAGGRVKLD